MYILIVNKTAGAGHGLNLLRSIEQDPLYKKANCRSFFTEFPGHAEKIASQVAEIQDDKLKGIIVIGGDGTLHEVMNGLAAYPELPIGFLPVGSGNDFARGIKLKGKNEQVFQRIVTKLRPVTYWTGSYLTGERNEKYKRIFVNSIGFGLDAQIAEETNRIMKNNFLIRFNLGFLVYVISLVKCLWKFTPYSMKLTIDGTTLELDKVWMVVISNHPFFGGGMKINPQAKKSAEHFGVMILHDLPKWKIISLFSLVYFGKHTALKEVETLQASRIDLSGQTSIPFQADGENGTCKSCHIWKEKQARKIFTSSSR